MNYNNIYESNPYFTYPWHNYYDNSMAYGQSCFCNKSFIRMLNLYEDNLNIQVNEIILAENLNKGKTTKFLRLHPGLYQVKILKSNDLIFESTVQIDRNLAYTGVVIEDEEDKNDISILMIPEVKENSSSDKMSTVRLINLANYANDLELVTSDNTVLFSGVNSGEVSNNIVVPSGTYTLSLKKKKNKDSVMTTNIKFLPEVQYSLFIAGNYDEKPDILFIIPEDKVNYLELC